MKMKFIFIFVLAAAVGAQAAPASLDGGDAQRLVAILDYIGSDYAGAVSRGAVVNPIEYEEQLAFARTASALASRIGESAPLEARVGELEQAIESRVDAARVAQLSATLRNDVVSRFGLSTVPTRRPSLRQAEELFARSCAVCHGARGDAGTPLARTLDPQPANFGDRERREQLSPYRVFNTLTFGVPGTAMASFESLAPDERWSLAFYVLRLGHESTTARGPVHLALPDLASRTDAELRARLQSTPGVGSVDSALAYARREMPFEPPGASQGVATASSLLATAAAAYRNGNVGEAQRALIDAYLQGFEPLEASLRARNPAAVSEVESSFSAARAALADRVPPEELETSIERIKTRMAAATTDRAPVAPFAAAFLVFFREGVEAALLVAALLTGVRRLGRRDAARFIHLGWMAALPAGVATWWLFQRLVSIGADRRELVEALVAIAAAIVLFSVSFWMISKAESRHWMAYLKRNLERALGARNVFLLSSLAFLAVYREAAETVLFLQALVLEAGSHSAPVLWGVAVALLAVVACAYVLSRAIHRLPLGPFFAVSGVLLCLLAVSFAGSGIHTLVASGHIAPRPVRFPEVPWLGIHPDLSSLVVQIAIVLTVAAAGIVTLTRAAATPRVPAGNKSPR